MTKDQIKDHIKRCLDNTAGINRYEDLGILYFARTFLDPCKGFRQSQIHYHMMINFLSLFDPRKLRRTERQIWVKVFREAAKSTHFSYVAPLYLTNLNGYTMYMRADAYGYEGADRHDYDILEVPLVSENIMIMSETHAAAERFTSNIRVELETNALLKHVFGNKTPRAAIDEYTGSWRKDMFQTHDGMLIGGQGAGQQVRGFLVGGSRITLAIFDDIYSRKNTLTEETREKLRYWFFAEAINSTDSVRGKAALLGTMVHEDTVFTDVAKSEQWRGYTYPAIGTEELQHAVSKCKFDYEDRIMTLPPVEELREMHKKFTTVAWKEKQNIYYLLEIYKEKWEQNRLSYFYQEQLNVLSAPEDESFGDHKFHITEITFSKEYEVEWIEFTYLTYRWKGVIIPTMGIDIASSERYSADDTAILVGGYAHVFPLIDGFDYHASQNTHPFKAKGLRIPVYLDGFVGKTDIYADENRGKIGLADTTLALCKKYNVKYVACEINGQQGTIAREIKKHLQANGVRVQFYEMLSVMRKEEAIMSVLQPIIQGAKVTVLNDVKSSYTLLSQLKHLGVALHDDMADALKNVFTYAKPAQPIDYQSGLSRIVTKTTSEEITLDWECY